MHLQLAGMAFETSGAAEGTVPMDYLTAAESPQAIHIDVTQGLVEAERAMADRSGYPDAYLANLALYRQIAEIGPKYGCFVTHMAVVEYNGLAYAFAAPSGTGKSTHVSLWLDTLGSRVKVINGDKPILRRDDSAAGTLSIIAYGTPWAGKEGRQINASAPLAGLCFLRRGDVDVCRCVGASEALNRALNQIYMPVNAESAALTLEFLDVLLREVPLFDLSCTMGRSAAKASFEAMTGCDFKTSFGEAK